MKNSLSLVIAAAVTGLFPSFARADVCTPFVQSRLQEISIPGIATNRFTGGQPYKLEGPYATSKVSVEKSASPGVEYVVRAVLEQKVRTDDGVSLYPTFKTVTTTSVFYMNGCKAAWADYGASDDSGLSTSNLKIEAQACSKFLADPKAPAESKKVFMYLGLFPTDHYQHVRSFFVRSNPTIDSKYLRWLANTCTKERSLFTTGYAVAANSRPAKTDLAFSPSVPVSENRNAGEAI